MEALAIGWPQGIYLFLVFLSLGVALANHGRPREPGSFLVRIVQVAVVLPLLYWGGFFTA